MHAQLKGYDDNYRRPIACINFQKRYCSLRVCSQAPRVLALIQYIFLALVLSLYCLFHSKTLICLALWVRPMLSLMRFWFSAYCSCCGKFIFNEWWDKWTIRNKRGKRVHFQMRWQKRCQRKFFDYLRGLGCWCESALKWVHTPNFRAYEPSNCFISHLLWSKILKSSYQAVRIFGSPKNIALVY